LSPEQPRDDQIMDAIPATQYARHRSLGVVGWGEASCAVDSVDQLGVKWALAALALLAATVSLMFAPVVVAVMSMAGER
jgi:hypothetical protein